jgi:hypothetical protein
MSSIDDLLADVPLPLMTRVVQRLDRPIVKDIEQELFDQLRATDVLSTILPGQSVAIAVGSRGITDQPRVVKALVAKIRETGGRPFVVPAMGSHGGATAEGQRQVLVAMGITEDYVGCPIKATMDVLQVGVSANGLPVYVGKYAHDADAIIVINRVKPHVGFSGKVESGLMKLISIGLGNQKGADTCHELGMGKMAETVPAVARVVLGNTNLLFGVALLENAYHETCRIEVLPNAEIESKEPGLLTEAKRLAPKLLFDRLDVLIMDEIGKDISGTGFDTFVVGRYHSPYISGGPQITRISVLDLTERTHGNFIGLGIVDFTTRRVYGKLDFEQTYPNSLTSTLTLGVKVPMVLRNDRQAIQAAIKTCNIGDKRQVRLVRIKNTALLSEIEVSESLLAEVNANSSLQAAGASYNWQFDQNGNLVNVMSSNAG